MKTISHNSLTVDHKLGINVRYSWIEPVEYMSRLDFKDFCCTVYYIRMTLKHDKTEFKTCDNFKGMHEHT